MSDLITTVLQYTNTSFAILLMFFFLKLDRKIDEGTAALTILLSKSYVNVEDCEKCHEELKSSLNVIHNRIDKRDKQISDIAEETKKNSIAIGRWRK